MALSRVEVVSQVLFQLGLGTINTIDSNNKEAVDVDKAYDIMYPMVLSAYEWRFATKIQQLSRLVDSPIVDDWEYQFEIPGDYLVAHRTYPNTIYQIYEDKIYTNINELKLEYRFKVDIGKAPSYFATAFIFSLAEYVSLPLSEKTSYLKSVSALNTTFIQKAAFLDAQAHSTFGIKSSPFVEARGYARLSTNGLGIRC